MNLKLAITILLVMALATGITIYLLTSHEAYGNDDLYMSEMNITVNSTVTVVGSGFVSIEPQEVLLYITVKNPELNFDLEKIYSEVISKTNEIVEELKASDFKVETVRLSINPEYRWVHGVREFVGYRVTYELKAHIGIDMIDKVETVLPKLVDKYVIVRLGFKFDYEDLIKARDEALRKAIDDALSKIEIIAKELNVTKIEITKIKVPTSYYPVRPYIIAESFSLTSAKVETGLPVPEIEVPEHTVSVNVEVTARLIS